MARHDADHVLMKHLADPKAHDDRRVGPDEETDRRGECGQQVAPEIERPLDEQDRLLPIVPDDILRRRWSSASDGAENLS